MNDCRMKFARKVFYEMHDMCTAFSDYDYN